MEGLSIFEIITILLLLIFAASEIKPRYRELRKRSIINNLQEKRNSTVIALIHERMGASILSLLFGDFISMKDSQEIVKKIRETPDDQPIDIILHTPGGLVLASQQIAKAISEHPAKTTSFIPHYAMSGGTLIALATDEIVLGNNALLGRVDPQIGGIPAYSVKAVLDKKPSEEIDDKTIMLADISSKAIDQIIITLDKLLEKKGYKNKKEIINYLISEKHTHDYPITLDDAKSIGLNVNDNIPDNIYKIMEIYSGDTSRFGVFK